MSPTPPPVFRWPVALALSTLVGLVAALVGGHAWAPVSWLALGLPIAAIAAVCWRGLRRRP